MAMITMTMTMTMPKDEEDGDQTTGNMAAHSDKTMTATTTVRHGSMMARIVDSGEHRARDDDDANDKR